mgnify:CR=1 FL=1
MAEGKQTYREPAKEVPVLGEYDVIVCGGGPAGCAAAVYAARHGVATLLVEKDGYLGGATVSQIVCTIHSTNGADFQGVWHEFMAAMKRRGGTCPLWRQGDYQIHGCLDPEIVKYAWDDLLTEAGVTLLHHVYVAGTIVEDGMVKGILVETKAGRAALYARRVIDCTGDGAVCAQAGVPWEQGDGLHKWAMALTKVFRLGNVHKPEGFPTAEHLRRMEEGLKGAVERGEYTTPVITTGHVLNYAKGWAWPLPEYRHEMRKVTSRVLQVDPLDPWDLTRAEREGREQAWQTADFYRKYVPGCEHSYLLDTSNQIGVRSSRRIRGLETVTAQDVVEFRKYPDGIARGSWDIDVCPAESYTEAGVPRHDPAYRGHIEQLKCGDYYDIRYGCLVPQGVDNLLVAGRCLSAEHVAQASLRIQQTCMATGQAAGTAAALSLRRGVTPRELDPLEVVAQLEKDRAAVSEYPELGNLPGVS